MSLEVQDLLVRKSIVIKAPVDHVFKVFTQQHDAWWPRSHHIGKAQQFTALLEPGLGGRWFERGDDGSECDWGRVLVWEPPARIVLSWEINAAWQHDAGIANEIEVRFVNEGAERTRLELEHRKIERFGDKAEMMRGVFDSEGGWTGILAAFAAEVERTRAAR